MIKSGINGTSDIDKESHEYQISNDLATASIWGEMAA